MNTTTAPRPPAGRLRAYSDLRRDRVADLVRVAALGVVIVWHSTLSLFRRTGDGVLSMPNPIGEYSGLWLVTWLLQVMPLFFVVSGSVNADAWERHRRRGGSGASFARNRVVRFLPPLGVLAVLCALAEASSRAAGAGPLLAKNLVVLVPLWTLALLLAYAPLTALLDQLWRRHHTMLTVGLVTVVALCDLVRFRADVALAGACSTALVWLLAYHLGWVYRAAVRGGSEICRDQGRTLALIGLAGLVVATNVGVYPRSMVATSTDAISNLLPTTLPIAALALFQTGLLLWARPRLAAWLEGERAWRRVETAGGYALPAYLLHMLPVVAVVSVTEWLAPALLPRHASLLWWLTRPLWLAVVAALLVPVLRSARRWF